MRDEPAREPSFNLRERTKEFALRIVHMFMALPKTEEAQVLGKQAFLSGTSVGASYRVAHRGLAKPEFIAKIGECLKGLDETDYWLELLAESKIISGSNLASLQDETRQLIAILTTILKKSKA